MTDPTSRLAIRSAAQRLHDDAAQAELVPATLDAMQDALTTMSRWPSPRDGAGPSYEQQIRVVSSLHDAGAALRAAAGHCARAARQIAATMDSVA